MDTRWIDLHTHSYISDGSDTPTGVVEAAARAGLSAIALTDHDEIAGVDEALAAGERLSVEVLPGIELSGFDKVEVHILGYYPDRAHPRLQEMLREIRDVRRKRMEGTAKLCAEVGVPVSMEEAAQFAGGGMICRVHFAKAMAQKGYAATVKEAFDRYLGNGKPCHFDLQILTPADAVSLLHEAGAVVSAAHLNQLRMSDEQVLAFLREMKPCGLDAVEGYYPEYTPEQQARYQQMAASLGLLLTGGSDYHGSSKPHIAIGTGTGSLQVPYHLLEAIKRRKGIL